MAPADYIGGIMKLGQDRRGVYQGMHYLDPVRVEFHWEFPLGEIVLDFYDRLKSLSRGYASLDYELGDKAVDGCYLVTDLLPSGLYPVTRPWQQGIVDDKASWPVAVDGQRVTFCVTKDGDQKPLTYYARVVGPGEYTAEPATLQSEFWFFFD